MKRLLEAFFLFLENFDTIEASADMEMNREDHEWWNERVWINSVSNDIKIPSNFLPLFDMIIEKYGEQIWEGSQTESEEEYYSLHITFNVENRIVVLTTKVTENGEEESGDYYEISDDDDVNSFLDDHDIESIVVSYEGGGDDGYIEDKGEGDDGVEYDLNEEMQNIVYRYLEQSFGGWENNEGASGKITVTKNKIEIDHIWNTRDEVDSDLHIVIKLDDVE